MTRTTTSNAPGSGTSISSSWKASIGSPSRSWRMTQAVIFSGRVPGSVPTSATFVRSTLVMSEIGSSGRKSGADPTLRRLARLRSTHDREILRLAVPALGALAAEPLYLLTDTAIVGHLGTVELAALALAATLLSALVTLCNFLTYGTTARVSRLRGAGSDLVARGFTGDDAVLERAEMDVAAVRAASAGRRGGVRPRRDPDRRRGHAVHQVVDGVRGPRRVRADLPALAGAGLGNRRGVVRAERAHGRAAATMGARFARGRWALVGASAR